MSGIRQYDIWIDGQKLTADFLSDLYTQAGYLLLLGFGDGQVSIRKGIEQFDVSATNPQENYAQLGGVRIEFQLLDDANGRRVLISSTSALQWAERDAEGRQGPFVPLRTKEGPTQAELAFGRTYVLRTYGLEAAPEIDPRRVSTMTLRVTDSLNGLEVGDSRSPSPVLEAPDEPLSEAVLDKMRLDKMRRTLENKQ